MMMIGMILFWVAVLAVIVLLVYNLMPRRIFSQTGVAAMETPPAILDRRLAAGEITIEEYDRLRQKLGKQEPPPSGA